MAWTFSEALKMSLRMRFLKNGCRGLHVVGVGDSLNYFAGVGHLGGYLASRTCMTVNSKRPVPTTSQLCLSWILEPSFPLGPCGRTFLAPILHHPGTEIWAVARAASSLVSPTGWIRKRCPTKHLTSICQEIFVEDIVIIWGGNSVPP